MKIISRILIAMIAILIGGFIYFISNFGPIISGFGSKGVCSCVFVGNRTAQSAIENELASFPLSLGSFEVNYEDSSATGSVFGFAKSKAIFRTGLGCTLVREKSVEEIKNALPKLAINKPILSDTIYWPLGKKIADTVPENIDFKQLINAVESSFANNNLEIPSKTRSVVVIYKGQLLTERYAEGFDQNSVQLGWSMTKSITNGLYGIMVKKGLLDVNSIAPVKAWADGNDPRHKITTDALLRMSSGLHWEEVYSNVSTATEMLYKYADMGKFSATQSAEFESEEKWYYSSGTTNILSKILRDKLGDEDYYTFAQEEWFNKIGVTSVVIEPDASGTFVGSSYMWATSRDWARLGQFYLSNGNWFGEQIFPDGWVEYTTKPTPKADQGQYGAQFWLNAGEPGNESNRLLPNVPTDMYMMDGYEGQRVFMVPSKDLVVVRLGQNKKGGFDQDAFLSSIIACIK